MSRKEIHIFFAHINPYTCLQITGSGNDNSGKKIKFHIDVNQVKENILSEKQMYTLKIPNVNASQRVQVFCEKEAIISITDEIFNDMCTCVSLQFTRHLKTQTLVNLIVRHKL